MFKQAEDELAYLRDVFKRYQEKNKRKIAQKEIEARSKNIDLLRRNLNLLQDEFKEQVSRMRKDMANGSGGRQQEGDFMNIFGINRSGSVRSEDNDYEQLKDEEEEREMYDEEKDILKQFEENDKELEEIAAQIVGSLDDLKGKAQNIELSLIHI